MSALVTLRSLVRLARQGQGFQSRCLAFLCCGQGIMGPHRRRLRKLFIETIGLFAQSEQVPMSLKLSGRMVEIRMRQGNEADYLVGGELVAGGYRLPDKKFALPTAIVDGGANIGVFTLQAMARFPELKVKCYEPDPANIEQLRLNLKANGINAEVVPKAMWSSNAKLFYHPGLSYSGFVSADPSPYPILCELPEVADGCWLKLDIEGAEYEVLPAILKQRGKPNLISMEIHDFKCRGETLMKLLRQHDYAIAGSFKTDHTCINITAYRPIQ